MRIRTVAAMDRGMLVEISGLLEIGGVENVGEAADRLLGTLKNAGIMVHPKKKFEVASVPWMKYSGGERDV